MGSYIGNTLIQNDYTCAYVYFYDSAEVTCTKTTHDFAAILTRKTYLIETHFNSLIILTVAAQNNHFLHSKAINKHFSDGSL